MTPQYHSRPAGAIQDLFAGSILDARFALYRWSLCFRNPDFERRYKESTAPAVVLLNRVALVLGFAMYITFIGLDAQILQGRFFTQALIRIGASASLIFVFVLTFTKAYQSLQEALISVPIIICGYAHYIMSLVSDLPGDYVRSAICLMLLYTYFFTGLRFKNAAMHGLAFLITYTVSAVSIEKQSVFQMLYNSFWLHSTNIIGLLSGYVIEFIFRRSFVQGLRLEEERNHIQRARLESEGLANLARQINNGIEMSDLLASIARFSIENFAANRLFLCAVDDRAQSLRLEQYIVNGVAESLDIMPELMQTIPLTPASGSLYRTFTKRRTLYLRNVRDLPMGTVDKEITRVTDVDWFVQLPLVHEDKVLAIVALSGDSHGVLSRDQIRFLERMGLLLASAYNKALTMREISEARASSDRLLSNILPQEIALELKTHGHVAPRHFDSVTVLFTDFVGFTTAASEMPPDKIVAELDGCFSQFDAVVSRNHLEKLKTIGDGYMCAGGLPTENRTHPIDACLAALELRSFMRQLALVHESLGAKYWSIRIGIHTGPVVAGVIGNHKFSFDIWGDTVNTASRLESSGAPNEVNISASTYELVGDLFECEDRGLVETKGKGAIRMYYLSRIRPAFAKDPDGLIPNAAFLERRGKMTAQALG